MGTSTRTLTTAKMSSNSTVVDTLATQITVYVGIAAMLCVGLAVYVVQESSLRYEQRREMRRLHADIENQATSAPIAVATQVKHTLSNLTSALPPVKRLATAMAYATPSKPSSKTQLLKKLRRAK